MSKKMSVFTARKRSLEQGNIFTSVCQEFCSRGGAWSGGVWSGGCLVRGRVPSPGGLVWGVPGRGGVWSGVPGGDPPPATAAGGTYPTGMHSCLIQRSLLSLETL